MSVAALADALAGRAVAEVPTPALLLDRDVLERNLARMRALAAGARATLRPHAKTHKSPLVAHRQIVLGAVGVCCAKLGEAAVMIRAGVPDVLVTTPVVGREKAARLASLARLARLAVVVDDADNVRLLSEAATAARAQIGVVVEVDVGQSRCGVAPGPAAAALAGLATGLPGLRFDGLQGYHGTIQGLPDHAERRAKVAASLALLEESATEVSRCGLEVRVLTGGGTGSVAVDLALGGLTELQPGSYVAMDASYARLAWDDAGTPIPFEHALTLVATVVSRSPDRAIVDVGWKTASVDSGPPRVAGRPDLAFEFAGDEHGTVRAPDARLELAVGDRVTLVPSHCDTTINLHDHFVVTSGDRVVDVWPIAARGHSQ